MIVGHQCLPPRLRRRLRASGAGERSCVAVVELFGWDHEPEEKTHVWEENERPELLRLKCSHSLALLATCPVTVFKLHQPLSDLDIFMYKNTVG